ncbi:MAG: tRNA glutamyl-Q(34) synthetase GluQRS [Nitrosomonadales bacterium]|jgi:glutamyl-Q tRNA(Asp) synthetase|nr:tRNA glutamyl-Q(34) synthetase GluQRS [Nitrosomonadales bacterium]
MYIGRFAPTPSGDLHFGSLVTAIASFLDARKNNGKWLLKIDDLDRPRVITNSVQSILKTLESLNLFWDSTESYQSQRLEAYEFYFEKLLKINQTYKCNCSRRYLINNSKLGVDGQIYPGFCKKKSLRNLDSFATRIIVNEFLVVIEDQIQGLISQNLSKEIGDFIIKRNDGQFSYQFAISIDNKLDNVTNIVRGADLLTSTPRQVYLQNLLDFNIPKFSHIPIATIDKKKISKSNDDKILIKGNQKDVWVKALRFLNQPISKNASQMNLDEIIESAINNWTISKVRALHSIEIF